MSALCRPQHLLFLHSVTSEVLTASLSLLVFSVLNFSPVSTPGTKIKLTFHLVPSVVEKSRSSPFTSHCEVIFNFAIDFLRFHNFKFSYFRSGISPEVSVPHCPSSTRFVVMCLESCANCQSPFSETREDLNAEHLLVGVLCFHDHGFTKEHVSKCLISPLQLILMLLSTYLILVINWLFVLFCFVF